MLRPGRRHLRAWLAAMLFAAPAAAQDPPAQPPPAASNGPYFRLSAGPALHWFNQTQKFVGGQSTTRVSGEAVDAGLMAGWRLPPGVAAGLWLSTLVLPGGQRIRRDEPATPAYIPQANEPTGSTPSWSRATLVGLGLDLFSEPTGVMRAQTMIGYASLPSFKGSSRALDYQGVALAAGLGIEPWQAGGLRAGFMAQIQYLGLRDTESAGNGNDDVSAGLLSLSLLASVSFR